MKTKKIIGRVDKVDLPDLGIEMARAKIDTGAYTSSLNCKKIVMVDEVLCFYLPIEQDGKTVVKKFETKNYTQKKIRSSNGEAQKRYVIKTGVILFGKRYLASFSLSDRSRMKNPILIGRKLLKDRFIVDVSQKDLSCQQKSPSANQPENKKVFDVSK